MNAISFSDKNMINVEKAHGPLILMFPKLLPANINYHQEVSLILSLPNDKNIQIIVQSPKQTKNTKTRTSTFKKVK